MYFPQVDHRIASLYEGDPSYRHLMHSLFLAADSVLNPPTSTETHDDLIIAAGTILVSYRSVSLPVNEPPKRFEGRLVGSFGMSRGSVRLCIQPDIQRPQNPRDFIGNRKTTTASE